MKFIRWMLGRCNHASYTWPQGRGIAHVACLECGADLPYSWEAMRVLSHREAEALRAELHVAEWAEQRRIDQVVEELLNK